MGKRWITIVEYYDEDTGEIITKNLAEREYIINGKSEIKYEENENWHIKRITNRCQRNKQYTLFE